MGEPGKLSNSLSSWGPTAPDKTPGCSACGSVDVPTGANFCPHCGARLSPRKEKGVDLEVRVVVPVAAAVRVDDKDDYAPPPTAPDDKDNGPIPDDNDGGAVYFKNPTKEIIKQSQKSQRTSVGIMVIQMAKAFQGQKFTLAKTITASHIMSGGTIDLSTADFVHPKTTIVITAILAGVKVVVPPGVRVEARGVGIAGEFGEIASRQTVKQSAGQRDGPLVVLKGLALLGAASVKVNDQVPPVRVVY